MEQVILFVSSEDASTQIPNVKREVIAYLGVRMIVDDFMAKGVPMIGLEEKLSDRDKDAIVKIVSQYSEDIATFILHEKKEVGNLDSDRKIMEFIQYEEPSVLQLMCQIPKPILKLMEDTKPDAKRAAFAWFNKCDLEEIQKEKIVLVDMDRVESFIDYANKKGVHPSGGAFTLDMKAQYLYI